MKPLKRWKVAYAYWLSGLATGSLAVKWQAHHPNWYLVMGLATGLTILVMTIALMRLSD